MRWKTPSERTQLILLSPVIIPMAVVGTPIVLLMVGWIKLWERIFPPHDYRTWFAWRPVRGYRGDPWFWLERVERKRGFGGSTYRPIDGYGDDIPAQSPGGSHGD